jgi:hypothetical protein
MTIILRTSYATMVAAVAALRPPGSLACRAGAMLYSPNGCVAHLSIAISIAFEALHFLLAAALIAVPSLRTLYRLSGSRAQPPLVAVLHIAEDGELGGFITHLTLS